MLELHRALHTDLEPLETVCMHYRQAHGDAMISMQRRIIAALIREVHDLMHRNANKTRTILALAERLTRAQWRYFLMQQEHLHTALRSSTQRARNEQ